MEWVHWVGAFQGGQFVICYSNCDMGLLHGYCQFSTYYSFSTQTRIQDIYDICQRKDLL